MKTQSLALLRALTALAALGFASLLNAQTVTLVATVASLQDAFVSAYSTDGVVLLAGDSATIVSQHAEDSPGSGAAAVQIGSVEFNPAPLLFGMVSRSMVFNGVLVQGGVTKVSLSNPTTNETKWVEVGKSYGGYTVGYEPGQPATKQTPATKDTVVLTLGGDVQRITLQDARIHAPVVEPAEGRTARDYAQASLDAARAVIAAALARARSDPNADARLIQALETSLSAAKQSLTDEDDDIAYSATASRINNPDPSWAGVDVRPDGTTASNIINHDRSATHIVFDANGKIRTVEQFATPDANGGVFLRTIYSAPNPAAPTTSPAAAK